MAKQVLVVDDNPVIVKIVTDILKKQGYKVRSAQDGLAALNILEEYRPDIIFIDLILPKISGELLCQVIRSKEQFKDTYIVILSGIAAETGPDPGKLGADTSIAKGKNLATHIHTVLSKIERGDLRAHRFKVHGMEDVSVRDVTLELINTQKHLEVILANLSDGLVEITAQGAIIFTNPAAEKLLATPQGQLLGAHFFDFFTGDDQSQALDLFRGARSPASPQGDLHSFALHNRFVTLNILPLGKGADSPCIVIMQDISERKVAEEALRMSEMHYREFIESTTDMVQNISPDGRIFYVNNAWKKNLGYSDREIESLIFQDIIAPEHREQCMASMSSVLSGATIENIETAFITRDGRRLEVLGSASCKTDGGKPVYTRGIFHDITERKQLEEKLQNSLADFEAIFENSLVGIFHLAQDGIILRCNKRLAEMAGYAPEEIAGTDGSFLHVSDEYHQLLKGKLPEVLAGKEIHHLEFPFKRKDGSVIWCLLSGRIADRNDPGRGVVGISDDITERKALEEQLKLLSTTDQLTGAYNRRAFEDFFPREAKRSQRYDEPLSLALLDIDHFKKINDIHGHDAGDLVLQDMVRIIKDQVRQIDLLFRWGGEEFLLLLPNTSLDSARLVVERLRQKVARGGHAVPAQVTVSIGVSSFKGNETAEALVKRADMALYQAKEAGRDRVVVVS